MKRILLATAMLAATSLPAAAQYMPPGGWNSTTLGNSTWSGGTGANQGWFGNSTRLGNQTWSTFNGPQGQTRRCTTSRMGFQTYTNCN